jgi:hypothetical protein
VGVLKYAVNAVADAQVTLGRFDVDVGRPVADCLGDQQVHETYDGRLSRHLGERGEVLVVLLVHDEVRGEIVHLTLCAIDLIDLRLDVGAVGHREPDPALGQPSEVVLELDVPCLPDAHGHEEDAVFPVEGQDGGTPCEVGRERGCG